MKNKSLLFQTITEQEINAITQKHFCSAVKEYALLKGGMFNTTYSVILQNGKQIVLRVGPARQDVLLPFELHLAEAEMYSCDLLNNAGIPSNHPIASDFTKEIIPRNYMIFEYIQGVTLSDKSVKRKNKRILNQKTGALTKQLHQIKGEYFGRISDSFRNITFKTWSEYIFAELRELELACTKHGVFTSEEFAEITSLFVKGKPYFDTVKEPSFVHADLWAGNIMISESQTDISAVIDTDRSLFGDPDMDLANTWLINDDFLNGYGEIRSSEQRKIKLLYYRLMYAIIDAYVWKTEYQNNRNYKKSRKSAKNLMKKIRKTGV